MTILYSVFGPFLVWPIEYFFPYPYIVEELFKSFVVWFGDKKALTYVYAGLAFAATETVFYAVNINLSGSLSLMAVRFVTSGLLHSLTFLVIFFVYRKNKNLIPLGFLFATLIHYLYNLYI